MSHYTHPDPAVRALIAKAQAEALREAADGVPRLALSPEGVRRWLRAHAERIEEAAR